MFNCCGCKYVVSEHIMWGVCVCVCMCETVSEWVWDDMHACMNTCDCVCCVNVCRSLDLCGSIKIDPWVDPIQEDRSRDRPVQKVHPWIYGVQKNRSTDQLGSINISKDRWGPQNRSVDRSDQKLDPRIDEIRKIDSRINRVQKIYPRIVRVNKIERIDLVYKIDPRIGPVHTYFFQHSHTISTKSVNMCEDRLCEWVCCVCFMCVAVCVVYVCVIWMPWYECECVCSVDTIWSVCVSSVTVCGCCVVVWIPVLSLWGG